MSDALCLNLAARTFGPEVPNRASFLAYQHLSTDFDAVTDFDAIYGDLSWCR
jgi:hypothetical protein